MNRAIYLAISFIFFSSCHLFKKKEVVYSEIKVESRATDFKLPKVIFDEIEAEILKETPNLQPMYLFTPVQVQLETHSQEVLQKPALRITFPTGGGLLDLKDYVIGQGTFSLSFPSEQFSQLPSLSALYYLSDSPQRKIDGEQFGLGCARFANLKSQFNSMQKPDFLKLNTTDLRHLYVAAGVYIFVFRDRNQVHLSHVHVTDSRYPDFYCSALYTQ